MHAIRLQDAVEIERFLRRDTALHIYEIGDLEPALFRHTQWYGAPDGVGALGALALLYTGLRVPTLLLLERNAQDLAARLLASIAPNLPDRLYAHLSPGLEVALSRTHRVESRGRHLKMALRDPPRLVAPAVDQVVRLGPEHLEEVLEFYRTAYPGNWFEPVMLEAGQAFGVREDGVLVAAAGVHVYAPSKRVAALGNIATLPRARGGGLGSRVTAALCCSLRETVDDIGLNVKDDNVSAIRCYESLGFDVHAAYGEHVATRR